jgi:uncharacterized Zn-finger protein
LVYAAGHRLPLARARCIGHNNAKLTPTLEGPDMTANAPEIRIVNTNRVACDGGEGALGHPRVWLQIPADKGWVECGYCDCKFIHEDFAGKV